MSGGKDDTIHARVLSRQTCIQGCWMQTTICFTRTRVIFDNVINQNKLKLDFGHNNY